MKRVAVFCGSSSGARPAYVEAAQGLGRELAARGLVLVYGGASTGLMGALANAALAHGGEVIGVLPRGLEVKELAHRGLSQLRIVDSMHERKALMADLADAFIALPGGYGTLDELFEVLTWSQLGIHQKPIGWLEVAGYFQPLFEFLDVAVREGFVRAEHRCLSMMANTAAELLDAFDALAAPTLHPADALSSSR